MASAFAASAKEALVGPSIWSPSRAKTVFCSRDLSPEITKPFGGISSKGYESWKAEPKGVGSVFSGYNVGLSVLRNWFLNFHPIVDKWFQEVLEQENKMAQDRNLPQQPLPPLPDMSHTWTQAYNSLIRDSFTQITRRWLEGEAAEILPSRTAAKMLKDVCDSIVRKAERGLPFLQLTTRVAQTAVVTNCLGFLSEIIVSQTVLCFRCFRAKLLLGRRQQGAPEGLLGPDQLRKEASPVWLGRQTVMMATSVGLRAVTSSLLVGLLANLMPKFASHLGGAVGDLAIGVVIGVSLAPWADQ